MVQKMCEVLVNSQKVKSEEKAVKITSKGALFLIPGSSHISRAVNNAIFNKFIPL
jgi:hypothetical protein